MKTILASIAICSSLAGTALAQTNQAMPDRSQQQVPLKPVFGYTPVGTADLDRVRFNALVLKSRPNSIAAQERRARMDRAERLAALVNSGRCSDAYGIALTEGDHGMADRIISVCSGEQ